MSHPASSAVRRQRATMPAAIAILLLGTPHSLAQTPLATRDQPLRGPAAQGQAAQGQIVALQGRVEHTPAGQDAWGPAALRQPLFVLDRVRTQASSRAAVLFVDETQVRLNAGAVLMVQEVRRGAGSPTLLDLAKGEGWFRTKNPASGLTVKTPAASAAIRGTEINVSVGTDGETVLTVVEGAAEFFNDFGRVTATVGEQAVARPGQAPVKRTILNPEDAVQWALYYPAASQWGEWPAGAREGAGRAGFEKLRAGDPAGALAAFEAAPAGDPWVSLGAAAALTRLGRLEEARAALGAMPGSSDAEVQLARRAQDAAIGLASGEVGRARSEIDAALAQDPTALRPLVLRASLALTTNRKPEARAAVDQALAAHPASVAALVAAAEVAQAEFDLAQARRHLDRALEIDPGDVAALVNRARLRFGTDDTRGARADVAQALRLAPDDPQVRSLSGFIRLSEGDVAGAEIDLQRAVAGDASFGEPHLGLGLLEFKRRRVAEGLERMLTATLLEPKVSLYQSYLGKAYYQTKRFPEGLAALRTAKVLDPRDPTPWLYASLFERDQNRQTAALDEVRRAIALNDNRAVYRSRFLLDRDEATANVSLAEIYRQLGFEPWGASEALKSVETDLTNASAHLFLGETYGLLTDRTQAFSSELLQYFIYAPVNRNSFNTFSEYTALIEQPYKSLSLVGGLGEPGRSRATAITRSGNEAFAHYAFVEQNREDGGRPDEDDVTTHLFGQAKVAFNEKSDLFLSVSDYSKDMGQDLETVQAFGLDSPTPILIREFRTDRDPNRRNQLDNVEGTVGYKHAWRAGSALTAAVRAGQLEQESSDPDGVASACYGYDLEQFGARSDYTLSFPFKSLDLQVQQATRVGRHQLIGGAQAFGQKKERRCRESLYFVAFGPGQPAVRNETVTRSEDRTYRGYLRDEVQIGSALHLTVGISYDDVHYEDQSTGKPYDLARWNPLVGLTVFLSPQTVLRVAGFRNLNNDIAGARISPTSVSGFVIERNEFPTAIRKEAGLSLEHAWPRVFTGARAFLRDTRVPGLLEDGASLVPEADEESRGGTVYANWLIARRLTLFADDTYARATNAAYLREDNQVRGGFSFVHERGLIARVSVGYFTQGFSRTQVTGLPESSFALIDSVITYEFAGKRGLFTLLANNLLDRDFRYAVEGVSVEPPQPLRRLLATLRWRF
jgi:tetratricopeptide (TPR) repeat protein